MKSARIHEHGDPSVIRIDEIDRPRPGPDEVLVEVAATSFNPTELALRSGALRALFEIDLPYTLGWDVAGKIDGEPVIGWIENGGAAAEYVIAPAGRLVPAPKHIPLTTAAAIPLAGLTAWQTVMPNIVAGQRVLINGAGGGIGGFAVQLAKHLGAEVIATASPRSAATAEKNGADQIIDYTRTSVPQALKGPVDVMIHLVGQAPPWQPPVRPGGAVISAAAPVSAPPGVTYTHVVAQYDTAQLTELVTLIDAGTATVDITATYPLTATADVHRASETGHINGKVLIIP